MSGVGAVEKVVCPTCRRRVALLSAWSVVDHCPNCGAPLMVSSRPVGVELAVRHRLYGGARRDVRQLGREEHRHGGR